MFDWSIGLTDRPVDRCLVTLSRAPINTTAGLGQLPGQRYTPDQQCQLVYGQQSYYCAVRVARFYRATHASCGRSRVCPWDGSTRRSGRFASKIPDRLNSERLSALFVCFVGLLLLLPLGFCHLANRTLGMIKTKFCC